MRYYIIAEKASGDLHGSNLIKALKAKAYQEDRATSRLLLAVCVGLLIVTSLGIYGQARFSVNRRKRQIGTRRALGASKVR